jgi:transcriptional regulator with XRE-family HTH domain
MSTYSSTLRAFLESETTTQASFAEAIQKTQAAVNRYANGVRFPDAETARAIDAASNGKVPFSAWQAEFMSRAGIAA